MFLQILQNIYPASLFYFTRHCYVRSIFVKHHFYKNLFVVVAIVFCLFVVTVAVVFVLFFYFYYYYIFNWYKLNCKFFPISNKVLMIIIMRAYAPLPSSIRALRAFALINKGLTRLFLSCVVSIER